MNNPLLEKCVIDFHIAREANVFPMIPAGSTVDVMLLELEYSNGVLTGEVAVWRLLRVLAELPKSVSRMQAMTTTAWTGSCASGCYRKPESSKTL